MCERTSSSYYLAIQSTGALGWRSPTPLSNVSKGRSCGRFLSAPNRDLGHSSTYVARRRRRVLDASVACQTKRSSKLHRSSLLDLSKRVRTRDSTTSLSDSILSLGSIRVIYWNTIAHNTHAFFSQAGTYPIGVIPPVTFPMLLPFSSLYLCFISTP